MAWGSPRFMEMAILLAKSIRLFNKTIPLAIATDSDAYEHLKDWYDFIIPLRKDVPKNNAQKTYLNTYSPFDKTIFIDADCLVFHDVSIYFDLYKDASIGVMGRWRNDGTWWYDVPKMCERFQIDNVAFFNGGFYYFSKTALSDSVFDLAKTYTHDWKNGLGQYCDKPSVSDECCMSVSFGQIGKTVESGLINLKYPQRMAIPDETGYYVDADICDALEGKAVQSYIFHFFGNHYSTSIFNREAKKIDYLTEVGVSATNIARARQMHKSYNFYFNLYTYLYFVLSRKRVFKDVSQLRGGFFPLQTIASLLHKLPFLKRILLFKSYYI